LMEGFKKDPNAISWVEKTPKHALYINEIHSLFPNGKMVAVVRDPRDVVSSESPFGKFTGKLELRNYRLKRAERWNQIVREILKHRSNEYLMLVRYEDLIEDTNSILENIFGFLEVEMPDRILEGFSRNYEKVVLPEENGHKRLSSTNEIVDRRGIWQSRMSRRESRLVQSICADYMMELGYMETLPAQPHNFINKLELTYEKKKIRLYYSLKNILTDK